MPQALGLLPGLQHGRGCQAAGVLPALGRERSQALRVLPAGLHQVLQGAGVLPAGLHQVLQRLGLLIAALDGRGAALGVLPALAHHPDHGAVHVDVIAQAEVATQPRDATACSQPHTPAQHHMATQARDAAAGLQLDRANGDAIVIPKDDLDRATRRVGRLAEEQIGVGHTSAPHVSAVSPSSTRPPA